MLEVLPAKKYYGAYATGVVVLVNGCPSHFTGKFAKKDAKEFISKLGGKNE